MVSASFSSSRLFTTFSSCLVFLYESFAPFSRSLLVVIVINQLHCLLFTTEISLLGAAFDNMRFIVFSFLPLSCVAFTTTGIPSAVPRQVQMSPSALDAFRTSKDVEITPVELNPGSSFDSVADSITDVCILGLRLGTCALMFHHGIDKIDHVDGFSANVVAKFFGFLPGEPAFWTLSAAATQIVGAAGPAGRRGSIQRSSRIRSHVAVLRSRTLPQCGEVLPNTAIVSTLVAFDVCELPFHFRSQSSVLL